MINAVLREPAREEGVFRKKLDTLFRQAHSVKGEAAALGLSSIESRAHSFEEDLKSLREKPDLSGNDFLPLVIKLDDLLTHLHSVGELVSRLSSLQPAPSEVHHTSTDVIASGVSVTDKSDSGLAAALQQLAARIATENNKEATLLCVGFDTVPEDYRRTIKDIAIQAVRNAIVHGIEPASVRRAAGKLEQGLVRLTFQPLGDAGYKFTVEDDGQGLATDRIKEVALKKGFITAEQAVTLDAKQTYSLLFKPGFSTVEHATKDAGRGVGMNLVADLMNQVGGRVGVATARGRFTRLTVTLPFSPKRADDTAAAYGNDGSKSMKLMIVDDSNIIRRRIERSQQIARLEVVGAASNGREAVDLFRRTQPDVVTMDLTMPEMDGIECVQELVALNPNVLILVVSALADKATAVEAIEKGANGFLCKPFSDKQLNEALEELLSEA